MHNERKSGHGQQTDFKATCGDAVISQGKMGGSRPFEGAVKTLRHRFQGLRGSQTNGLSEHRRRRGARRCCGKAPFAPGNTSSFGARDGDNRAVGYQLAGKPAMITSASPPRISGDFEATRWFASLLVARLEDTGKAGLEGVCGARGSILEDTNCEAS